MPVITSIEPQKSLGKIGTGQKRMIIYLDGKFAFGLDLESLVKEGLKVGQELTEKQIDQIIKLGQFQSTYDKILNFAIIRPRSEYEFRLWLIKHKIPSDLHEELFNRLMYLQLLDDKKFAFWWVTQRKQFKFKSRRELVAELLAKRVSKEIIDEVLTEEPINEIEAAKKLLEKKKYLWKSSTGFEFRKKASEFLLRRGYRWEVIKRVVNNDIDL